MSPAQRQARFTVVGKPRRRVDARAKVTGQTRFADDLFLPRMLHCKLLRSPHPHARILRIDLRAAADPGVKLLLTGCDMPTPYGILPVSQDEHALCLERVRFVGDPVAAVVAVDEQTASEALDRIRIDYEPLATIASPREALETPEPKIQPYGDGNIHKKVALEFGDVDAAMASAESVFEDVFFYEGNTHLPIEQHAALAAVDPDGKLTVWSATQTPHYVHRALARVLGIPAAHIRVIATPNGGGFGGKSDPFNHEIVVAKAALLLGRPVKICLTREEVFYCHRGRHPVLMKLRTGVQADGRIVAMDLQTLLDGGAYGSYGVASTFYTGALQTVTYEVPRYRFRGCRAFTNKPPCGPKRGHGTPQPRFAQEVQLDKIAVALEKDPAELRKMQIAKPNSLTANFMRIGTIGLGECIDRVVEGSGWKDRRGKLPFGQGLGLACSSYLCGAGLPIYWNALPHSGVQLQLDRSGRVTAFCGATEIGQGSDDVLANLVAEVLGIDPFDLRLVTGDTDLGPVDLGSYSSRVTLMMGHAAIQAAERARDLIASAVSRRLGIPLERVVFAQRRVFDAEDPDKGVPFAEAVQIGEAQHGTLGTTGSYRPPESEAKYKGGGVGPSPAYSYSACVAEVRVHPETGWVEVERIWIAHDIGRALNPVLARGQVEGSVYMALGEALLEEMAYRRLPKHLSGALVHKYPSLLEYKSPTTLEMPDVVTYLVEQPDGAGPFGAKEVGQGPLLPVMPALANAVYDAVGIRVDEVPITPEKVLRAMADRKSRRFGPSDFPRIDWPEALRVAPPAEGGDGTAANEKPRRRKDDAIVAPDVAPTGLPPHPSTPEARRGVPSSSPASQPPEVLR
ncbi:MAG TPA: molybdopterin cofactor-binding domain-containing protein [Candidatus Polarisedimenticolia bacterium]|nr:molybdopterin cofactor-binding domain-containing protein [Candidatus Polarisedimenticolia bacterium]